MGQRNRIEERTASVWHHLPLSPQGPWSSLHCLIRMEHRTEHFQPTNRTWRKTHEVRWYVCTQALSAPQALQAVRGHWQIENGLHYVRDVSMGEDASRIRRSPGLMARLRSLTLNLLRPLAKDGIRAARQCCGWDADAAWQAVMGKN